MDLRKRRKHSIDKLPVGTVRTRRDKRADGTRYKVRVIKVSNKGRGGEKWMGYARWLWEQANGPVPQGKRVLHRDGDVLNDDLANLMLGTCADALYIHCHADPDKSAENYRRAHVATSARNREQARVRHFTEILPSRWYAVDLDARVIVAEPHRRLNQLTGVASVNGGGWQGWALGWPGLECSLASILAALAALPGGEAHSCPQLLAAVNGLRARWRWGALGTDWLRSAVWRLKGDGMVCRVGCGRYRIAQAALESRGPVWPYVPLRGSEILADPHLRNFSLQSSQAQGG